MDKKVVEQYIDHVLGDIINNNDYKTNIFSIAQELEFVIYSVSEMNDVDGFIFVDDERPIPNYDGNRVIGVDSKKNYLFKRIFIARALSYYLAQRRNAGESARLKFSWKGRIDNFILVENAEGKNSDEENEVVFIADNLLMPKAKFLQKKAELTKLAANRNSLAKELSEQYEVPVSSVLRRMNSLDSNDGE
jgi:hypothetical protein